MVFGEAVCSRWKMCRRRISCVSTSPFAQFDVGDAPEVPPAPLVRLEQLGERAGAAHLLRAREARLADREVARRVDRHDLLDAQLLLRSDTARTGAAPMRPLVFVRLAPIGGRRGRRRTRACAPPASCGCATGWCAPSGRPCPRRPARLPSTSRCRFSRSW
jgi:hypothetical protein